jgi:glycosyltransferase involved in cell wall biosynthesis
VVLASVVIPAYDAADTIGRALDALARQDVRGEFEVIVVDDGSSDETAAIAATHPIGAIVAQAGGHGAATARNVGASKARGRVLAFTDADCEPTVQWLSEGLATLEDAELMQGAVAPRPDVPIGPFDRTLVVDNESGLYESANLFVRRDLFDRIGGFSGWIGPNSGRPLGEDVDFGWRARRAGARTTFNAKALVYHAVFPRRPVPYVVEHARRRHFPAIARHIPELRSAFFYRRWFLSPRTARFDLAIAGAAGALWSGRPWMLVAAVPYLTTVALQSRGWGLGAVPRIAAVGVAADVVSFAALVRGSVTTRTLVL